MDLREYLFRKQISIADFSKKIGYSRTYISLIVHKKMKPSKRLAAAIEEATEGIVKVKDLLGTSKMPKKKDPSA